MLLLLKCYKMILKFTLFFTFIQIFRWRKIFNSRIVSLVKSTGNYAFIVSVIIMVFLFLGESSMSNLNFSSICE